MRYKNSTEYNKITPEADKQDKEGQYQVRYNKHCQLDVGAVFKLLLGYFFDVDTVFIMLLV